MTWVDVAWTMMATASLTLGLIHLLVWFKQRTQYVYFWFFVLATSVAVFGAFELAWMRAQTPSEYALSTRWAHVPIAVIVLSILAFVRLYFGTGRLWLAYAAAGLRLLALALNFVTGANLNFREVTGLAHVPLWGGVVVSAPIGEHNPWDIVANLSNLLLVAFVVDAAVALWRRGGEPERRRALLVGGGLATCIVAVATWAVLIVTGTVRSPTILTAGFFVVVLAMGYELGRDVAHAAQLAHDLRESERRTELATRAADLAIWTWDPVRDDIWMAARGRALFGFEEAQRIDFETFLARVLPDDRERVREAAAAALRDRGGIELEYRIVLPSGETRWVAARGQIELDTGVAQMRGVALDVTARRRLERDAAQQRAELAHLSRVATMGELSGSLAHEINQPLMGILSNAQAAQRFMAGENPNLEEVREILTDIVEDDKRAGEVIRRLRAFLRKEETQRAVLDLNEVVDDVLRLARNDLMNRDVVASVVRAPQPLPVLGDRIQLQQVLLNLVMNACDAMNGVHTGRQVTIRTRGTGDSAFEVAVSDRGKGIPASELERIFEPFVTTKEQGMGLGLSVCTTIVAAHGGKLWAESPPGEGATFRFTLPAIDRA